jgi:hypothetical protein
LVRLRRGDIVRERIGRYRHVVMMREALGRIVR